MPIIYSIRCNIEPYKEYIGQTGRRLQERLKGHRYCVSRGDNHYLYNAIRKHGWENFTVTVLHSFPKEDGWEEKLDTLEVHEIRERNTIIPHGYNYETGGNQNKIIHELTRELISESRSGERHPMFGKNQTEDTKNHLRLLKMKKVQAWSYEEDELLGEYSSLKEASDDTGINWRDISAVCRGVQKSAGGFRWKFVDECTMKKTPRLEFSKIQQLTFDNSILVSEFDTMAEASRETGVNSTDIGKCIRGSRRSAGGFKWKAI